jgi:hypothetical protein
MNTILTTRIALSQYLASSGSTGFGKNETLAETILRAQRRERFMLGALVGGCVFSQRKCKIGYIKCPDSRLAQE